MLASYPSAWLLLTLPFVSMYAIRRVPWLLGLAARRNLAMRLIGTTGLAALLVALSGAVPPSFGLPMMVLGGVVSGFTVFTPPPNGGSDGDDWRRWRPPPDEPPPPHAHGPLDWEQFDRVRVQWERQSVLNRCAAAGWC